MNKAVKSLLGKSSLAICLSSALVGSASAAEVLLGEIESVVNLTTGEDLRSRPIAPGDDVRISDGTVSIDLGIAGFTSMREIDDQQVLGILRLDDLYTMSLSSSFVQIERVIETFWVDFEVTSVTSQQVGGILEDCQVNFEVYYTLDDVGVTGVGNVFEDALPGYWAGIPEDPSTWISTSEFNPNPLGGYGEWAIPADTAKLDYGWAGRFDELRFFSEEEFFTTGETINVFPTANTEFSEFEICDCVPVIPEPSTSVLALISALCLGFRRRR